MKVKELIAQLQVFDGELPIMVPGLDGSGYSDEKIIAKLADLYPTPNSICHSHVDMGEEPRYAHSNPGQTPMVAVVLI